MNNHQRVFYPNFHWACNRRQVTSHPLLCNTQLFCKGFYVEALLEELLLFPIEVLLEENL